MTAPIAAAFQTASATMADTEGRQAMEINAEIQKCRQQVEFWTNKLEKLEAEQRRTFLLARIRDDPGATWDGLSQEKRTKEVVIAFLAHDPHFFGECPWRDEDEDDEGRTFLPEEFVEDRDVVLAYARGEHYEEVYGDRLIDVYWYTIPEFLRGDKEAVLLVCTKHWRSLEHASPRLRDDKHVVLSAIKNGGWNRSGALRYVSERLRGDHDVLLAVVANTDYDFS